MARQQERARRTRAAIIEAASVEFAKRGYAAASVNTILEGSHATKGAMYFHFQSKEELARAVLTAAGAEFSAITQRWTQRSDLTPLDALHALILDVAGLFRSSVIVQAEFRLIIEPEFYADVQSGGAQMWGRSTYELAMRAQREGQLRPDADPARFARVLAAGLAGQRYMADLTGPDVDLAGRFEESLDVVLAATASPEWLATFEQEGWQELGQSTADLPDS